MDLVALTGNLAARSPNTAIEGGDFYRIAIGRSRAVGIHIVDFVRGEPGVGQAGGDSANLTCRFRADEVRMVATRPVADDFAVNPGATGERMLPVFEYQRGATLAQH